MGKIMSMAVLAGSYVRPEIVEIFRHVFQFEGHITPRTSPDEVASWDSLQHIALVRALETTFCISLSMDEMAELRSVADIERVILRHGV
jgi:acyl carrier protein